MRPLHNHFDNFGNYVPGFCAGISFGDCRELNRLLEKGIDTEKYPILGYLMDEDLQGLFKLAEEMGYRKSHEGYFSKCHLCIDMSRASFIGKASLGVFPFFPAKSVSSICPKESSLRGFKFARVFHSYKS